MRIGKITFGSSPGKGASPLAISLHADKLYAKGGQPFFCGKCGKWFDHRQFKELGVSYEDHWNRCGTTISVTTEKGGT